MLRRHACCNAFRTNTQEPAIASDRLPPVDFESLSETATDDHGTIAMPQYAGLRKRFLNRLAQVLARRKHAAYLTAATKVEYECVRHGDREDHLAFYWAHSTPSEKQDAIFLAVLKRILETVAHQGKN